MSERKSYERLSDLTVIRRAMADSKRRAMRKGILLKDEIANFIISDTLAYRSRTMDDAVWWALALRVAESTRERSHDKDDPVQGVFDLDLPVPIRMSRLESELPDGRVALQEGERWVIRSKDGKTESADPKDIPEYIRTSKPRYVDTKIIEVRNFKVFDGDQRTRQMQESLERDQIAFDRWVKGWSLIRPLLVAHPLWTLGEAVDYLRDRDEWPRDLDPDDV
jgi:hypothetical protein